MNTINLNNIERRIPVLDSETVKDIDFAKIKKQWNLLTETIRKEILVNPILRDIVFKYIWADLKECLAIDLSVNERISKLMDRYKNEVIKYLELDEVPDELVDDTINKANILITPEKICNLYRNDETISNNRLNECIEKGTFKKWITYQEKALLVDRYTMARDIKLLSLSALLQDNKDINIEDNVIKLDSWVIIYKNSDTDLNLLDSKNWINRKQLKDRVYEINIWNKKYILKERKTSRHKDSLKIWHKNWLTSQEEFEIANFFKKNCIVENWEIMLNWETPIASVLFPDGYQFTIFEYEEWLIEEGDIEYEISNFIFTHKEIFEEEYENVKNNVDKYINDDRIIKQEQEWKIYSFFKKIWIYKEKKEIFSFENYLRFKIIILKEKSYELMEKTMISNWYSDYDSRDYFYKIHLIDWKFKLEIIWIDLEYMEKIDKDREEFLLKKLSKNTYLDDEFLRNWRGLRELSEVQQAGGIALDKLYCDGKI